MRAKLFALLLIGCSPCAAQSWEIRYSAGVSLNVPASGEEFSFEFPRAPGSAHYITRPATPAGSAVVATFTVMTGGSPVFDYRTAPNNTCDSPATVRLFLQRRGDNLSGAGAYEFYRWWSRAGVVLADGTFTLDVPLQPSLWTSVFGKSGESNPRAFAAALADLSSVGVTFGGGCFYGHGVRVLNGRATFTMKRFEIR